MSISHSLSNALSGMTAASRMAEVVSSNVANSLTDGYGRRSLNLSAAQVGGRGAGVEIGSITRFVDRGLLSDRRMADAGLGAYNSLVTTMQDLEGIIGQAGSNASISARIVAVETALVDAATDPSSTVRLTALKDRIGDLASGLNEASRAIQDKRAVADKAIADQVATLNQSLLQVERLNADIQYFRNTGSDPSSLVDERQRIVDQIAQIVPVRELDRDAGAIALMTPSGETLLDGKAKQFGFTQSPVITADMTIQSGGLSGLTVDGTPLAADGIGKMGGGTLGAAFQARDLELVNAQIGLDHLAADLVMRFQDPSVDTTLSAGDAGLLTDGGGAFDAANLTGLAGRIALNAAVDPEQGGFVSRLRDGINAATSGPAGNAALLLSLSSAMSDPRTSSGDVESLGAAGRAASLSADIGARRLGFEVELGFENARWTSLKEAEAANGVDTDYEMQMLLRIEQAYSANARVVQTVDTLIQRLLEI